ncbi:MAG: hypothetical protein IJ766_04940 [Clostridia bacterium]|nr:hypothetical protein [Clostridia bacterium]
MTNALRELNELLSPILPVETGVFSKLPPETYAVLTPLVDTDDLFGDNRPDYEIQEVRISLYTRHNYIKLKNRIVKLLYDAEFCITEKRYIEHEDDTGYYHYAIDVAKQFEMED